LVRTATDAVLRRGVLYAFGPDEHPVVVLVVGVMDYPAEREGTMIAGSVILTP
jgi:hypothetical protein